MKEKIGAGNGVRTRDPRLGKPMLYQLSYARSVTRRPTIFHAQNKRKRRALSSDF